MTISAWGVWPAYQQDFSEPQNGAEWGLLHTDGEPDGATGTIIKTSSGWLGVGLQAYLV